MRLLLGFLLVVVLGCAPQIAVVRTVPPRVILGADVQVVNVEPVPPPQGPNADPAAVRRNFQLAPPVVQRIEQAVTASRLLSVMRGCAFPCPGTHAGLRVQVSESSVKAAKPKTQTDRGEPNEASIKVTLSVVRVNGLLVYEGVFDGWAQGDLESPVTDEELLARAGEKAAERIVSSLSSHDVTDLFALEKEPELEVGNQHLVDGNTAAAVAAYREVVAKEPTNAAALYSLGVALVVNDELQAADEAFARAADLSWIYSWTTDYVRQRLADEEAVHRAGR